MQPTLVVVAEMAVEMVVVAEMAIEGVCPVDMLVDPFLVLVLHLLLSNSQPLQTPNMLHMPLPHWLFPFLLPLQLLMSELSSLLLNRYLLVEFDVLRFVLLHP